MSADEPKRVVPNWPAPTSDSDHPKARCPVCLQDVVILAATPEIWAQHNIGWDPPLKEAMAAGVSSRPIRCSRSGQPGVPPQPAKAAS